MQEPWHLADEAYQAHHRACATCKAAGAAPGRIARCEAGALLWQAYEAAGDPPHFLWLQRKRVLAFKARQPTEPAQRWDCAGGCGSFQLVPASRVDTSCDLFVCATEGACAASVRESVSERRGVWVKRACGEFFGARLEMPAAAAVG